MAKVTKGEEAGSKKLLKEEDQPIIEVWKDKLHADLVLRKEGVLYFLEEVVDLEIIP